MYGRSSTFLFLEEGGTEFRFWQEVLKYCSYFETPYSVVLRERPVSLYSVTDQKKSENTWRTASPSVRPFRPLPSGWPRRHGRHSRLLPPLADFWPAVLDFVLGLTRRSCWWSSGVRALPLGYRFRAPAVSLSSPSSSSGRSPSRRPHDKVAASFAFPSLPET